MASKKDNIIRFGVADNGGNRAATWTVTNPYLTSEIYLSCRELGGILKVSFHSSGSWHFQFLKEASKKYFETDKSKYIEIWPRPKPIILGVTLAFRIVTPYTSVTTPMSVFKKEIFWIPNCDVGFATEVDFFITSDEAVVSSWPGKNSMGTKLIGSFQLQSGETLWIIYWTITMPNFNHFNGKPLQFVKGSDKEDLESAGLRAIAFGREEDGSRTIFDCAVQRKKG